MADVQAETGSFDDITSRLDEIVDAVRDKHTSLERSLDLFDEAIALGSKAVDMVDSVEFTEAEAAVLDAREGGDDSDSAGGAPAADAEGQE